MPEADFIPSQLVRAEKTLGMRMGDLAVALAVVVALFVALLAGLTIQPLQALLLYVATLAALAYLVSRPRWTRMRTRITSAVLQEKGAALATVLVLLALYPVILKNNPYLIQIGALTCIYLTMALGLNITLGYAGLLDIGFAVYFGAGAYTSAQLAVDFGVSFWIGLLAGGLVAAFFGFLVAWPALRVQDHYLGLVTLGYGLMMNLLARNLTFLTNGTDGVINIPPPVIGDHDFTRALKLGHLSLPFQANFYYLAVVVALLAAFISYRLRESRLGRALDAIREDEIAARCSGVNVRGLKILAFSTGAFFGGLGGAVYAHMIGFVGPDSFTFMESITILVMVVLGGAGSILGVVAGAIVLVVLPERFREFDNLRLFFFGVALVLLMINRPQGLFPRMRTRRILPLERIKALAVFGAPAAETPAARRLER